MEHLSTFNENDAATKPTHEKLFDEICNKLNELSHTNAVNPDEPQLDEHKFERIQTQIKKFQSELSHTNTRLTEKIKSIESVTFAQTDLTAQLRQLSEQLNLERGANTKLSTDLSKSLELCLQLQLEIQNIKSKAVSVQNDERKYSHSLLEKIKSLLEDIEFSAAEISELKSNLETSKQAQKSQGEELNDITHERNDLLSANEGLITSITEKDHQITKLNSDLEELAQSLNELEASSHQQTENMRNLTSVAEEKMIELQMAVDKKTTELNDTNSRLEQSTQHMNVLKQENMALKDYINKLTIYQQQMMQAMQSQQQQAMPTPGAVMAQSVQMPTPTATSTSHKM